MNSKVSAPCSLFYGLWAAAPYTFELEIGECAEVTQSES